MTDNATTPISRKRELILPPLGRAYWVDSGRENDLAYLSWGLRSFGVNPVPVTLHHGWVYTCILGGSQILETASGRRKLGPGDFSRVGPDCAAGWSNPDRAISSRQITWVWRSPPSAFTDSPLLWKVAQATAEQVEELTRLHEACRREVARSDAVTLPMLERHRQVLDLLFQRMFHRTKGTVTESRLQFAISWLDSDPLSAKPLEALREYLDVSASTLERLFKRHLGVPPAVWLYRHRMRKADALRAKGMLTKEIAYVLGYRFPNDLSRALKRWQNDPANQLDTGQ